MPLVLSGNGLMQIRIMRSWSASCALDLMTMSFTGKPSVNRKRVKEKKQQFMRKERSGSRLSALLYSFSVYAIFKKGNFYVGDASNGFLKIVSNGRTGYSLASYLSR